MVKEFLSQRGIPFIEKDVSRDRAAAQELVSRTRQMGVPVTLINGQTIIGFDRGRLEQAAASAPRSGGPGMGAAVADAAKVSPGAGPGAYIGSIRAGSTAEQVGLRRGDIITGINRETISTAADLERAVASLQPGARFSVVFSRNGARHSAEGLYK